MIFVVSLESALVRLAFTMTTFPWAAILALWGRNRPWNRLLNGPTFNLWAHSPTDLECLVVCWVSRDSLQILNNDAAAPNNDKRRLQRARTEAGRPIKKRKVLLCCLEKRVQNLSRWKGEERGWEVSSRVDKCWRRGKILAIVKGGARWVVVRSGNFEAFNRGPEACATAATLLLASNAWQTCHNFAC